MDKGTELHCFAEHMAPVHSVAISTNGRAISGDEDGVVWLWDIAGRAKLRPLLGHTAAVYCVAFSSNGRLALSGGKDTTVRIWNVETGEEMSRFEVPGESIWSAVFAPDDDHVLVATRTRTSSGAWVGLRSHAWGFRAAVTSTAAETSPCGFGISIAAWKCIA
jgi:WD40 repeat protein